MRADRSITVVGCHAEGEVGRVITGGVLPPPGDSLFAQKTWLERDDSLRQFLLYEPRGGAFVHANLVVPAKHPGADAGFIIMEPTDYPPMSGSDAICVATVLLETGMLAMQEPETRLTLETPGGLVEAVASCRDGRCEAVRITNVPSFVAALDAAVEVEGLGTLDVDSRFDCVVVGTGEVAGVPAITPSLRGRAWITGLHHYTLDPDDPFPQGYTLSDTWYRAL